MKRITGLVARAGAATALVTIGLMGMGATVGAASAFSVDDTGTATDANPGDGVCATMGGTCTLAAALAEANAATAGVTITVPAGLYTLASSWTITNDVTVIGAASDSTVIDLDGHRGFTVDRAAVTFGDVMIRNGSTDGDAAAVAAIFADVTLQRVAGRANVASDGSGGFLRANAGTVTVTDSTFTDNQAYNGGALAVTNSKLVVDSSTFTTNAAAGSGGAIWADHPTDLTVTDSTFDGNISVDQGGAVYLDGVIGDGAAPAITGSTFSGNRAANEGGGIFVASTGGSPSGVRTLTVDSSTFDGNAGIVGGAIASDQGRVAVTGSTFTDNEATDGAGGAIASGGAISVGSSHFTGNAASTYGGAVAANGPATITGSTFAGNTAGSNGGALALVGDPTPTVTDSTFTGNQADVDAGAIWRLGADLNQSGLSFVNNSPNDVTVETPTVATKTQPDEPEGPDTTAPGTTGNPGDPGQTQNPPQNGTGAAPSQTAATSHSGGLLATTGAKITVLVAVALVLVALGFGARTVAARRSRSATN